MNTAPHTAFLPAVFRMGPSPTSELGPLDGVQPDSKWLDAVGHLSMFCGKTIPDTCQAFRTLLQLERDPSHKAVLLAGLARGLNSQMRLREGGQLLGQAWSLLTPATDAEQRAFVQLEMARFLMLIGNSDAAGSMLDNIQRLARSEFLRRQHHYYRLALQAARGESVAAQLELSAQWFMQHGQKATAVAHFRMLAQLALVDSRPEDAEAWCLRGLELAAGPELQFCRALMLNDLGMLHIQQGKRDQGMQELAHALSLAEFPYSRIDSLDLMGRCLKQEGRHAEAIELFTEGLNIALEQGTLIIVPALCLYLAQCHESLNQLEPSRQFHSRAYLSTMELLRAGYPATPTRLEAIESHVRFSASHPGTSTDEGAALDDAEFAFALAHSLKEIRTIFQNALLELRVQEHGTQKQAVQQLGIAHRTLSNVRQRHRQMGSPATPASVTRFVRLHPDLDWKDINQKFDDTILAWLYQRYEHNRKLMSDRLGLSYPHLSALISRAVRNKDTRIPERIATHDR